MKQNSWFWDILSRYLPLYRNVFIASIIVNLLSLAMPLFVMNVYDRVVPNNAFESLWVLAIGMILAAILDFILRTTRAHFVDIAGRNADIKVQKLFMQTLLDARFDDIFKNSNTSTVGALITRVRELEYVRDFMGSGTLLTLTDLPFVIIFIALMYYLGGVLAFIPLVAIPVLLLFSYAIQTSFEKKSKAQMYANAKKQSFLSEMLSSLETIRITGMGKILLNHWESHVELSSDKAIEVRAQNNFLSHSFLLINIILSVSLVILGVYQIAAGNMTTGALIACVILFGRCAAPLNGLINVFTNFHKTVEIIKQFQILMQMPSENPKAEEELIIPQTTIPVVMQFENVSFSYPMADIKTTALKNINMQIRPGVKVGFMGSTGSGKSTLARLCVGLYLPTSGNIMLGQLNMASTPMRPFRNNIGYLPQEVHIFKGTLRYNIALAWNLDSPCPEETILEAAELSGVMDFASSHPLGLDMPLGEQGAGISGGQAQAVALARALLGNPHTLILDEPSAQLDLKSEQKLIQRLEPIIANKTLLLFTHKVAMLQLVNKVITLEKGQMISEDSKEQVIKNLYGKQ